MSPVHTTAMPVTNDIAIQTLTPILRADNDARPVFLLGAGASFSSGIPMAAECVKRISKRVFADRHNLIPEKVKVSEWSWWLQAHDWFISGEDRLADNFPLVVQHLLTPKEYRKRVLMDLLQLPPGKGLGKGYRL